jgi:periplasmic protein TonB
MIPKKSKNANLEDKRAIFLEIGMIFALALALTAFNWKTYERKIIFTDPGLVEDIPVDMVPVTVQKPPEPPRIVPPRVIAVINIVDDESIIDEDIVIDAEIDPMDAVPEYISSVPAMEEEVNPLEEEIFTVVESMPMFPGGEAAMYAYLQSNMTYPRMAIEAGISGKVYVTFVVEKDGTITDVKLLRGIGGGCDEEAIRVVKKMPVWKPGSQRNIPVRVQYIMNVKFTLAQM